ncbi:hypothetical protein PFICI_08547 [Pestalotiopsis fici W106-1]|uniref:Dihydroxyacetone kinase n=1 Tax=Pestalotiopsis fici (strain W106-1 / CGMCC3.15140) TaxID=1229662 RepID=W3WY20_PESFW|nr:uncharacterized protein PFICI_08547 [Pestalotiopsis fici W106-1]ETS78694.1 hypothetical protein PFICI_08547 [Pestalotiopsis fici W106-1]
MSQKHFIDNENTSGLIEDALESLMLQNGALHVDKKNKIVYNAAHKPEQCVTLIAGGGAGHEPAHAMYVGSGMLSAAVSGNLFASPSVKQIYQCASTAQGAAGTILIIKNYTGDVFHFHQAAEKLRATLGGRIEVVVVADDVAVGRRQGGKVGRRGLAGTVLVHKILGAMAASRLPIDQCLDMAREVNASLATMGVSLDHVRIPGTSPRAAEDQAIGPDEMELGMGIHNETGAQRLRPRPDSTTVINLMLDYLLFQDDEDRAFVDFGDAEAVVLMVNNLGALSVLELSAITLKVSQQLGLRGIKPSRTYSGTYMTSLNGPGFSITLLRASKDMLAYLDAPTSALGWSRSIEHNIIIPWSPTASTPSTELAHANAGLTNTDLLGPKVDAVLLRSAVTSACQAAIAAAPSITKFDMIVGDGDCGSTLQRACEEVMKMVMTTTPARNGSAIEHLLRIAHTIEDSMDGTSGAIYGLFFNGLVSGVREIEGDAEMTYAHWIQAARTALQTVQKVTPARAGDRTLMDALEPFVDTLQRGSGLAASVAAVTHGADRTKGMQPKFGRAVYVNEAGWDAVPDPGAMGVVALVQGLAEGISSFGASPQ